MSEKKRRGRWYFGGIASAAAACVTHPLDLLKVQMQTHKGKGGSVISVTAHIIKKNGIMSLYNGISASLLRQLTYSTARFGIYEVSKQRFATKDGQPLPILTSMFLAGIGGLSGGFVGNPGDLVNVRMQNDVKLPIEKRRNYKHVFHGIYKIASKEGVTSLWTGSSLNCIRAAFMTIGQVSFYEQVKARLLNTPYFDDNVVCHIIASLSAAIMATTMTQPVDVLKTRIMNAKPDDKKSILQLLLNTAKEGPTAFFKGYIPACIRLTPQTILTFVFLEQLTQHFGIIIDK